MPSQVSALNHYTIMPFTIQTFRVELFEEAECFKLWALGIWVGLEKFHMAVSYWNW